MFPWKRRRRSSRTKKTRKIKPGRQKRKRKRKQGRPVQDDRRCNRTRSRLGIAATRPKAAVGIFAFIMRTVVTVRRATTFATRSFWPERACVFCHGGTVGTRLVFFMFFFAVRPVRTRPPARSRNTRVPYASTCPRTSVSDVRRVSIFVFDRTLTAVKRFPSSLVL